MNIHSLSHSTVKRNILKAMVEAVRTKLVAHVENRKGHAYIAVRYNKGKYTFTDSKGVDLYYLIRLIFCLNAISARIKEQLDKPCYTPQGMLLSN